jgi:glucose-1-phosphate cytidylyltransferase
MKVVLLSGGFGTRISEYSEMLPKPMISVGGKPIIWHIMNFYARYNHKDFYLALGYKAAIVKEYFLNYHSLNSDFTVDLSLGSIKNTNNNDPLDWKVTLVDTGLHTMTGGRVKRMKEYIGNETFMLTYGDGLSDININDLLAFHRSHGKMITMTAVRPQARFGELEIQEDFVLSFKEKPQLHDGWVNGGYFIVEPEFFDLIDGDSTMLERDPLELAVNQRQLMAYRHNGFWQCMDTKRDHAFLESLWEKGAPWQV